MLLHKPVPTEQTPQPLVSVDTIPALSNTADPLFGQRIYLRHDRLVVVATDEVVVYQLLGLLWEQLQVRCGVESGLCSSSLAVDVRTNR